VSADRPATTVEVSGPVTLAEAPRWREAILAALARGQDVRLDLAAAGPWDAAGLQLVLAALASGRRAGQAVRLARVPRVFLAAAEQGALADHLADSIEGPAD
jgi:ABC-type transporter Mla MlaB component